MLNRKLLGAAALAVLAGTSMSAQAAPTTHILLNVDFTNFLPVTSASCGFPVLRRDYGPVMVSLFFSYDGTLKREEDSGINFLTTWFSPSEAGGTGKSFTSASPYSLHTEYPEGAVIGAPAVLKFTGMQAKTPGLPGQAGLQILPGVIIDISPEGIPVTDVTGPFTTFVGQFDSVVDFRATVCQALSP